MKRLALLLALLASPAIAADTIALQIGGGSGGACNVGNITAGNFTCTATITDSGGTWHTQLIATYQQPCNTNINGVCTSVQVLAYIKTVVIQALRADVNAFNAAAAAVSAATMVPVN
jgi:hypothetical protein